MKIKFTSPAFVQSDVRVFGPLPQLRIAFQIISVGGVWTASSAPAAQTYKYYEKWYSFTHTCTCISYGQKQSDWSIIDVCILTVTDAPPCNFDLLWNRNSTFSLVLSTSWTILKPPRGSIYWNTKHMINVEIMKSLLQFHYKCTSWETLSFIFLVIIIQGTKSLIGVSYRWKSNLTSMKHTATCTCILY